MNNDIPALRQHLQQLQALHKAGTLDEAAYAAAKAPLERQLLDKVLAHPESADAPPRPASKLVALLVAGVVGLAVAGYLFTGDPGQTVLGPVAEGAGIPADEGQPPVSEAQVAEIVERLSERLKERPDDPTGWSMLARAYSAMGRHAEAVTAYERVLVLQGESAQLLADYADAMAAAAGGRMDTQAQQVVARALVLDPNHAKSRALAGSVAFDRGDYLAAVGHWQLVAQALPPDSPFMSDVLASIAQARQRGNVPPGPVPTPVPVPTGPIATIATVATVAAVADMAPTPAANGAANGAATANELAPTGPAAPATPGAKAVSGRISLAPALAAQAAPDDTVFIVARAAEGPRMPLAVLRKQVRDLPLSFMLDDSMAMAPTAKISDHAQVIVIARISKSGDAMPKAGDLSGQSAPVAPGASGLALQIDQVVGR